MSHYRQGAAAMTFRKGKTMPILARATARNFELVQVFVI